MRAITNSKAIATTIAMQIARKKKPAIRKNATMGMTTRRKMIARILYFMEFMGEIEGAVRSQWAEGGSCTAGMRIGRGKWMHEFKGNSEQSSLLNLLGETLL